MRHLVSMVDDQTSPTSNPVTAAASHAPYADGFVVKQKNFFGQLSTSFVFIGIVETQHGVEIQSGCYSRPLWQIFKQ